MYGRSFSWLCTGGGLADGWLQCVKSEEKTLLINKIINSVATMRLRA